MAGKIFMGLVGLIIGGAVLSSSSSQTNVPQPAAPTVPTIQAQTVQTPAPQPTIKKVEPVTPKVESRASTPAPTSSCDPNYTPCVPNVSYDLDCADIGHSVTVVGYDKHGFDGNDNDGQGCESY